MDKIGSVPRLFIIGLLILAAVLPVVPLLIVVLACSVAFAVERTALTVAPRRHGAEQRLALLAVACFRGPPPSPF
jgi:hypothetical protein